MKIGLTYTGSSEKHLNYFNWIKSNDKLEIIKLSIEDNNLDELKKCDGLVLSGGVDIHPRFYGSQNIDYEFKPSKFKEQRDQFEIDVFKLSQEIKIPVLGICRGLQLINCVFGGDLKQDLSELNETHKGNPDKSHPIKVEANSLLKDIVNVENGKVNSAHHQAINQLGQGLKINARADDGTIEGIERNENGHPFLLAVQWHPERMEDKEKSALSKNIRDRFIKEIKKNRTMQVINPATEEIIKNIPEDDEKSIHRKFTELKIGQAEWSKVPLENRAKTLQKFSELLKANIESLALVLTSEVGKPLQQSRNEINGACARIQWLTENAQKYLSDETMVQQQGLTEKIAYEPLGVIANISAWNYPYLVGVNVFVPALLAGNAVMYKPSEYSSLTGIEIEKLLKEAGVPASVFHVAIGARNVGEILLNTPFDGYFFTGSYKTGKYIYEKVALKMVPCQCELGGKDPLYVADDIADIKSVAAGTADGAFYNNGQSCCAVERIYVHEKIYDTYVDEFVKEVKTWKLGKPTEDGIYFGPLSRKEQSNFLKQQVDEAVQKGAKVLMGGKPVSGKGFYFEPTVLVNVNHTMSLMRDESFGPVIGIMRVKNDEEALVLMKDTEYGLTASVYSSNQQRGENILQQLNSGTGYWNCCDRVSAAVPWSGRKHSGFGATLSHVGLRAFTKPKAYHLKG